MVFFLSNMIENQCMSTGAFEITLNGESGAARFRFQHRLVCCVRCCQGGKGGAWNLLQSVMVCGNCRLF